VLTLSAVTSLTTNRVWHVYQLFKALVPLVSQGLYYEGSYVDSYLDSDTRNGVVTRLETARDKTHDAWYVTHDDRHDHVKAIELLRQVFGDRFPAYG
jgi:hypothetical protein